YAKRPQTVDPDKPKATAHISLQDTFECQIAGDSFHARPPHFQGGPAIITIHPVPLGHLSGVAVR
ncbi:hypothetical protein, partial [Rubellimicrobium aerolatum]|uniref:hypothetical protein n=1 Tax=Rubellimicrobium aerolatum TaxID=490979 RepID=UPI001AE7FABD